MHRDGSCRTDARRPRRLRFHRLMPAWAAMAALLAALSAIPVPGAAAADARLAAQVAEQREPFLATLKQLVEIESGSRDLEGLDRLASLIGERLRSLGAEVELIEPGSPASPDVYRMADTPERIGKVVKGTLKGNGTARILLIAHMDTVYQRGMLAQQPFRIDGDRAYGLGISDDKQGIAVILHVLSVLRQLDFNGHGRLTVLINGDEEISSPGSRALITQLASEHDAVLSHEAAPIEGDKLSLATAGIGSVVLKVAGRASHAGSAPERGVNALYELAHQVLQMRDLSDPSRGVKLNWTVAQAGSNRNVIPAEATATADVRVNSVSDFEGIEAKVRDRLQRQLLPEAKVEMTFERRRPPLEANDAGRAIARHAQSIYADLGRKLGADTQVAGGGTDAAFAGLRTKGGVVERFGLQGFGAHSANAEYILIGSIEPRLHLVTQMVIDLSSGRLPAVTAGQ